MSYAYFKGKIVPVSKVRVNPYDLGFLRGYAVFDVMKVVNQKPFLIREHWKRLKNSAKEIRLKIPFTCQEYKKILSQLLKKNKFSNAVIRTVLTGGVSKNGFSYQGKSELFVFLEDGKILSLSPVSYRKGVKVISIEYKREIPQAKVTNYLEALSHQLEKKRKKAAEILYFWKNKILEASTSNIFMISQGEIFTPRNNILIGITRNLAIKLARANNYKVYEKDIKMPIFLKADEVFLTASNKDILPVVKIDDHKIGQGKPGPITLDLMEKMANYIKKY